MPSKDPNNWAWMLTLLGSIGPSLYAATLAFTVALVRALHAGGKPVKSLLEALLCGCLTLAIVPVLDYWGIDRQLAVALGAMLAFLGVEWFRDRVDAVAQRIIEKWLK